MFPSLQSDVVLMLGRAVKDVKTQVQLTAVSTVFDSLHCVSW
jgi:hypothetical protein